MMAAAALARGGHRVAVFEQMSFPGGRYTEIDHQGYSVTTAAWTPIGPRSNIGKFMADLGAPLRWITLKDLEREGRVPPAYKFLFADGREYESVSGFISRQEAMAFGRALAQGVRAGSELKGVSTREYISRFVDNPDLMASIDANVCTASGMTIDAFPASEYICFIQDMRRAGSTFGFPVGGPRAIIEGLREVIEGNEGRVFTSAPVQRILVEGGRAAGLEMWDGSVVRAGSIIHNAGPRRLLALVGTGNLPDEFVERVRSLEPVDCAALILGTTEPLYQGAPVLLTPGCQRVVGLLDATFFDASVAPPGRTMLDVFFPVRTEDREAELELAMADLRALFPKLDDVLEMVVPMFFVGDWTGAETAQTFGQVGEDRFHPRTPIRDLYLVGMDVKGSGVAGDLIPLGVRLLLDELGSPFG
jgi:phytoene dehydrogenase-like protein